ncbi:hypothetical protein BDP27DRAFT_1329265 [Rhodocollybia butyracea]|uniref:Secreted protein n=1 Tax=Rhodocollybia butyracea TaxID=206335 RepID=A0A9P5P726_9AGAR|nr:hypothetical protein BDP27DRAFT_1343663 [Rhodocollybia butyracea]KAF9067256.1 hypothetical protein BDP27DRAFT_1329265 [Rhodocollybia butyracea]
MFNFFLSTSIILASTLIVKLSALRATHEDRPNCTCQYRKYKIKQHSSRIGVCSFKARRNLKRSLWQSGSSNFIKNEATSTLFRFNSDIYPADFNLKTDAQSCLYLSACL